MSIEKVQLVAFVYKISTPVTNIDENNMVKDFYSYKFFEKFLHTIIKRTDSEFTDGKKFIDLISIKQSSDADILEGVFHTSRYGTKNDIIDIKSKAVVANLHPTQGVRNSIHFVINRKTGVFIIQSDPFKVATRNTIVKYFDRKQILANTLVDKYNKNNHPNHIYKEFIFAIETMVDEGFYQQLRKLATTKELKVTSSVEKPDSNAAISTLTKDDYDDKDMLGEVTDVSYSWESNGRGSSLKHIERFVKNVIDLEKVSNIKASGYNHAGKSDSASFSVKPVKHFITTTKNSNGELDESKIIEDLIKHCKKYS
ncbi:hypothetical protein [Jeotgalibacillus malaysiensis]|uniref:hypothetical protein n=1 Tax=Jeotgalibacillus malaysiensis TaxID=1508404 RepID=UPI00384D01B3